MNLPTLITLLFLLIYAPENVDAQATVLRGAGAAFALPVYEKWWFRYAMLEPVTTVYKPIGSYYGKRWIRGEPLQNHEIGEPIIFAGSDYPLTDEDYRDTPHLQMIPIIAGALVVAFNIPGVHQLRLTRESLASIYFGDIQYWNDDLLQAQNVHTMLPHKKIQVLARRDEAGVTEILTKGLTAFDDLWAAGPDIGMSAMLLSMPYSIGYVSVAEATDWGLDIASLENKHGETITPDMVEDGVNIAMSHHAVDLGARMVADLIDTPLHKAYPLATFNYLIINMSTSVGISCNEMKAFLKLVTWMMDSQGGIRSYFAILITFCACVSGAYRLLFRVLKKLAMSV